MDRSNSPPFNLNTDLPKFLSYIKEEIPEPETNSSKFSRNIIKDFNNIKSKIIDMIFMITRYPDEYKRFRPFYIYDIKKRQIICIGILSDMNNNNKKYNQLVFILSIPNTRRGAGKVAIYKLADKIEHNYNGIYVGAIPSAVNYYKKFKHVQTSNNTFILSKNQTHDKRYNPDRFILVERDK